MAIMALAGVAVRLVRLQRSHAQQISQAEERLATLSQELQQSHAENKMREQEIHDFLTVKDNRHELETLTPSLLQTEGEGKFRQRFELLHPLFLPRLRDRVPTVTQREELLSMLIVLKQDNKRIAELLAIAPAACSCCATASARR